MYKPVLKEFNGAPVFEILRNGQPWNDELHFAGKTHFSFGVRKARSIIHAEVLIRQYVSSMGAETTLLMGSDPINMTCPQWLVCRVDGVVMEARVGRMTDVFLNRLLNLKVARDRKGMAPNKPLLVLAILDLVEAGLVGAEGLVHKDAQLNLRFRS